MTQDEAVERLRVIRLTKGDDPESAHAEADQILLAMVPEAVREQYEMVAEIGFWYA